jgi:hypothetical protein
MTYDSALAKARALRTVLLAHGVPEVSIELVVGRPVTGDDWDSLGIVTNFSHHVASYYSSTRLTPLLALVKSGRSDVPGPLANGYGGWDLCARIICMGYANHPGAGGPITVGGFRIPENSARKYAFGWEFEGGMIAADWDRMLQNPRNGKEMTMREFMARCGAGLQDYYNLAPEAHLEHLTWAPDRKIDRRGYTQAKGIAEIKRWGGTTTIPTEEWDMATGDEILNWLKATFASSGSEGQRYAALQNGIWTIEEALRVQQAALLAAQETEDVTDDAQIAALQASIAALQTSAAEAKAAAASHYVAEGGRYGHIIDTITEWEQDKDNFRHAEELAKLAELKALLTAAPPEEPPLA